MTMLEQPGAFNDCLMSFVNEEATSAPTPTADAPASTPASVEAERAQPVSAP